MRKKTPRKNSLRKIEMKRGDESKTMMLDVQTRMGRRKSRRVERRKKMKPKQLVERDRDASPTPDL